MDKYINKKIKTYVTELKAHVKQKTLETFPEMDERKINDFLQEIYKSSYKICYYDKKNNKQMEYLHNIHRSCFTSNFII